MDVTYVFDIRCPSCGRLNEISRGVGHDHPPGPGDVSICFECGEPAIYTEGAEPGVITVRPCMEEEMAELLKNPQIVRLREEIAFVHVTRSLSWGNDG